MSTGMPIGGYIEFQWFQVMVREVRSLGGAPDAVLRVFRDRQKVIELAKFIIALSERPDAPADPPSIHANESS